MRLPTTRASSPHPARRPLTRALRVSAASSLLLAGLAAGPANADPAVDVPDTATRLDIAGHGYGHGRGMSQYGALGAAERGLTWRQITQFYYPGTTHGTVDGLVSVRISADTTADVVVLARDGVKARVVRPGGQTYNLAALRPRATRWRINPVSSTQNALAWRVGDRWRRHALVDGVVEFTIAGGAPISLVLPNGTVRRYRGTLRAAAPAGAATDRDTVNILSLENYLRGVVPLEMPALWRAEAVRSQAVVARTYAAFERAHPRGGHFQICDTTQCQVYGGYDTEHPASNAAVDATARQAVLADGQPAFTQFSSSSGGWTAQGSFAYLAAQKDPYDATPDNPNHTWRTSITPSQVSATWPALGKLRQLQVVQRDGRGEWGGRVQIIKLVGSRSTISMSGDAFRSASGLRSTWFTVAVPTTTSAR